MLVATPTILSHIVSMALGYEDILIQYYIQREEVGYFEELVKVISCERSSLKGLPLSLKLL